MVSMKRSVVSVRLTFALGALLALFASVHSGAQTPSKSAPPPLPKQVPPPPQEQPPAPPGKDGKPDIDPLTGQPHFVTRVDLVSADVIARDNTGQFVADLKKEDFEVWEDGVKQDVISFTLVHGGRVYNVAAPPPPPPQEGIILPASRPVADTAGRILLFFVDDLHLDFRNTGRIRELFKKIQTNLLHEGDMWGMVSTGPSSIAIDMTYDPKRFEEAMKKISGNGLKPSDIIEGPQGAEGPSEVRYRAHVAFSTAYDLMKNMEQVQNRRKALVYVSNGYDFNPFPEARAGQSTIPGTTVNQMAQQGYTDPFTNQSNEFADADLARELSELTRAANRANVTVYTIDPRGLVGGPDLDENVDPVAYQNMIRKTQDSLRVIADETGGIAVVNQNDFDKALKRIDAETSDYYVLGYYSSNPDPTKRHRRVEIKVHRPSVNVWSRNGYSLKPIPKTDNKAPAKAPASTKSSKGSK
jgi:VWFA-related protein